jgi:hypothetical protein
MYYEICKLMLKWEVKFNWENNKSSDMFQPIKWNLALLNLWILKGYQAMDKVQKLSNYKRSVEKWNKLKTDVS